MEYDPNATETQDAEGVAVKDGDRVRVIHMDDALIQHYVGKEAVVEWSQDVWPFCQVFLNFETTEPGTPALSTFSKWVRKVS